THNRDVLGFHDLTALLSGTDPLDTEEIAELRRQRDLSVIRNKRDIVARRWTFSTRLSLGLSSYLRRPRHRLAAARTRATLRRLDLANQRSSESLLDPAGPVVSMTTQSHRLELVHYAIESIARGRRKPSQLHLWLTDEPSHSHPPPTLERLRARGMEIHLTEDR